MSTGKIVALWLAIIAVIIAICLGIYFAVFATAHARGKIQQHNQLNTGTNLTLQQRAFVDLYADIQAAPQQEKAALDGYKQDKKDGADESTVSDDYTRYTGILTICQANVQKYNAQTQDSTRGFVLPANLPTAIPDRFCEVSQ